MKLIGGHIIISLFVLINCTTVKSETDLYKPSDDVLRLKTETFKTTVFKQNGTVTHVVQFYNSFCGHCQMFAPIYKELATRLRNWTSVVKIAGIDCSKEENVVTCSESRIEGYPTIFIYPPGASSDLKGDAPLNLRTFGIEWTVDDIEETIISYVGNLTTTRTIPPAVSEAIKPLTISSIDKITRIYPSNKGLDIVNDFEALQDLMLVVESDKSFLGRKLIFEYYRISSRLEMRRVLLSNKILLRSILSNEEYNRLENSQPLLLRINQDDSSSKAQVLVRGEANHILPSLDEAERQDFILGRFKMFFEQYYGEELKEADGYDARREHSVTTKKPLTMDVDVDHKRNNELEIHYLVHGDPNSSKKIFAVDVLKGIAYMLTHEIKIKGDLTAQEFNTIRNVLTLFKKYLPLDKWDVTMSKFVTEMRTRLDADRIIFERNSTGTGQTLRDIIAISGGETLRMRYSRENWITCYDSDRQNKGYPCSLWLLFHTLTVGEYTRVAPVRFRPTLVLTTMRDYITRFFGCTVCSSNFAKESDNLESNLLSRNSSVLWLWHTHNRVNQRLNDERQDKKKVLADVLYPKYSKCPSCYKTNLENIGQDSMTLDDIEWNKTEVLDSLVELYGPDRVVTPVEMASMLTSLRGKANYDILYSELKDKHPGTIVRPDMNRSAEQWNIQSIFSASDMSICLFLYFCCIVIVAIVCYSLNPRFKRCNTKSK